MIEQSQIVAREAECCLPYDPLKIDSSARLESKLL